jgi:hypothetical protein
VARRGVPGGPAIDVGFFENAFLRVAGAIVLETLAFIVWNIGTRSPIGVLRDARAALRDGRKLFAGIICTIVGFIFIVAASILIVPICVDPDVDFLPAELFTLLVALAIEHLIGNDVRALAGPPEEPTSPV